MVRKSPIIPTVVAPFILALTLEPAGAQQRAETREDPVVTTSHSPTLEEIVGVSPCIFSGTVMSVRYGHHEASGQKYPYTFVRFGGIEFIRGKQKVQLATDKTLEISHFGGIGSDLIGLSISRQPRFELGGRYLVFLRGGAWRLSPLPGLNVGYFRLSGEARGDAYLLSPGGNPIAGFENGYPVIAKERDRTGNQEGVNREERPLPTVQPGEKLSPREIEEREAELRQAEKADVRREGRKEPDQPSSIEQRWEKVMKLSELTERIRRLISKTDGRYKKFAQLQMEPVPFPQEGFQAANPAKDQ